MQINPNEMHCSHVTITGNGAVGPATFAIAFPGETLIASTFEQLESTAK
jgi:hypothetical protein